MSNNKFNLNNKKILVCMKQVVEVSTAELGKDNILDRDRSVKGTNPSDNSALEQALLFREAYGAEISVLTMGPDSAADILRQIAPLDLDRLILISDKMLRGSDTLATAVVLKRAIELLGPFDLIFMGRRSIDSETGHVGPQVAALLGIPCITNVTELSLQDDNILCKKLTEASKLTLRTSLPVIVTMCEESYRLRPASIAGLRKAKTAEILHITNSELELPLDQIGLSGSRTRVKKITKTMTSLRKGQFHYDALSGAKAIAEAIRLHEENKLIKKFNPIEKVLPDYKPFGLHGVCVFEKDTESLKAGEELICNSLNNGCEVLKILVKDEGLYDDLHEAIAIADKIKKIKLNTLVFPATILGRSVAPMVAAINKLGITADCTELNYKEDGSLQQIRPTFGETILAEIETIGFPQIATVRPNVYKHLEDEQKRKYETLELFVESGNIKLIEKEEACSVSLMDSKGIIAGGRACGRQGFDILTALAKKMSFGLGASRLAVDEGYVPYEHQVGQTGITIHPKIYIAFGISGSVQHLAGVQGSDYIIAVNNDKKARIFDHADLCIVADWRETAEILLKEFP